jgi:hypothetical protein
VTPHQEVEADVAAILLQLKAVAVKARRLPGLCARQGLGRLEGMIETGRQARECFAAATSGYFAVQTDPRAEDTALNQEEPNGRDGDA